MQHLFQELQRMGAGDFAHLNGSLEQHLIGTASLLDAWQAPENLCVAGLFHAAYGTAEFSSSMVSSQERHKIAALIGESSERLVYLYCCCDRAMFYPLIGTDREYLLPDRFTGLANELTTAELSCLCELTAANELEIAAHSEPFRKQYGAPLAELFSRMGSRLSSYARVSAAEVLANDWKIAQNL